MVDTGKRPACGIELPYPAECVGAWLIMCDTCGTRIVVTAAGRPDDPKAVVVPCIEERRPTHWPYFKE